MRTRRSVIAALGALLFATLTFPTSAADPKGTLAFVNGIPGKRVDVCLNGREIKSGLAYGRGIFKNVIGTGDKNVKFYERDPRTCGGTVLAKDSFAIASGEHLTIVATRKAPKMLRFDNAELGEIPPLGKANGFSPYAWRNAAEVDADFSYRVWGNQTDVPVSPTAIFTKGQQNANDGLVPNMAFQFRAIVDGDSEVLSAPIIQMIASHRYEWILVGTSRANARFVFLDRLISHPSP